MSLSILNNVSALYAQNSLNSTQASLQNTLKQLSSGSRINSGADDAAGLAISDGLHANEAALTQSAQNATAGIGLLQTADGALSQVTNLLDRAVTLATESANGTLTKGQVSSANQEYQNILAQIGNIGATTNFNSSQVFSSHATNIVVTDGTSSGLNTYADTIGALTISSVGTTEAAPVTTSSIAPTSTTTPAGATSNTAGVYTFTPNAGGDTLSGKVSFAVGSGTQASVTVAPNTTLTQLKDQLNGTNSFSTAGLTATLNSGNTALVITGPTTGANAAANTVSFAGTSLNDTVSSSLTVANGVTAAPPTQTSSSLAFSGTGVAAADSLAGSITYQVGSSTAQTFTLAAVSTLNAGANTDVAYQLNHDAVFQSYGLTASASGTALTVKGSAGSSEAIVLGTGAGTAAVKDTTHTGIVTTNDSVTGAAGTAGTSTLTLSGSGNVLSGSILINGKTISGASGAALQSAITSDSDLQLAGVTATLSSNVLTIRGNAVTGTAPVFGANSLRDSGAAIVAVTPGTTSAIATSALSAFSSGSAGVVGGTIVIGGSNINITAASNGNSVASQINTAMQTAGTGITASFDSATKVLSISGNANGSTLPSINASGLTDVGAPAYSATSAAGATAQTAVQATQTMAAFSANTGVLGGSITINGHAMAITPASTGADLANLIASDATMMTDQVTASYDTGTNVLTIKGAANGSSTPIVNTSTITDTGNVSYMNATTPGPAAQTAVVGTKTMAAFSGNAATVSGSFNINGHAINITGTITGQTLATQISTDANMVTDHVTANFDQTSHVLTISGNSDGSSTPTITSDNLSDSGSLYAGTLTSGTKTANSATMTIGGSDVLSGDITVGGHQITGATSGSALAAAITTAGVAEGLVANYNSSTSTLTIIANAASGAALNITSNNLVDSTKAALVATAGTNAVVGTKTASSIALGGAAVTGDVLAGNITYTDSSNSVTNTFTMAAGTTLDNNAATGLSTRLNADATFQALNLTASITGTTLTIKGAVGGNSTIALGAGTLTDVTNNIVGAATNNSVLGSTGTSATKVLTLNNASDSFGGSININSNGLGNVAVSLAGLNGQQAALAITNNATLAGQGVSAAWSSSNKQLTITGNGTGTSLAVSPVTNLSDNSTVSGATGTVQATGGASTGATSTIQLGSANDTVSGNLRLVVGNSGLAKDTVSFAIAANTTGAALASQINGSSSFRAAGVSAAYNSSTFAVTLTGPTGTTNILDASGSSLTDSTSAVPQGGADFTTDAVKELTHDTAAAVLINVTAAVADVAYQRGTIGADINQLTSASNVASSEQVNLTSAEESIRATNYGQAASDLSKYQILSQTGISALAQANSVQQEVLKLLQ